MRSNNVAKYIRLVILVVLFGLSIWVILNRQYVIDQVTVWRNPLSTSARALSTRATFTPHATFLYQASLPGTYGRDQFNTFCEQNAEKTSVLGCYSQLRIYIFDVTDARLDGIKEVTAAHEMLHAAYDRLSTSERDRVNALIETQAKSLQNPKLQDRLALYEKTEPGERLNELHSILGSEISSLSPELEAYYRQYFVDRSAVVALSNKYESVFDELEASQKSLIAELNTLADTINSDMNRYTGLLAALQRDISTFNTRAESGDFSSAGAFNSERSQLMSRQTSVNQLRTSINDHIATYETKKKQLDELSLQAEQLQNSIRSTAIPEAPQI